MKKIYTHPNLYQVVNIQNLLAMKHIETTVRNEFVSGGAGELAPQDVWPELWLQNDSDETLAKSVINEQTEAELDDWFCGKCGESNAGSFDYCWQCETTKVS
jgi:hypothetical protein